MAKPTHEELDRRFIYSKPDGARILKHEEITNMCLELAKKLTYLLPDGRNLTLALTHLEDVRMRANAALATES